MAPALQALRSTATLWPTSWVRTSNPAAHAHTPITEKGRLRSWVGPNGQYYRELPCPSCRGRGYTPCKECGIDRSSLDCPMCNGKGIRMCLQCSGECVIWQESVDEQPWEKVRSRSTAYCFPENLQGLTETALWL
ncbi:uncharacterized protein [Miscanthus floridulus]|uniref:uncharacterized protein isoform X2 n=1 Tax=Miscanthus floridulus TaxID=154761 RepID=UPI003459288F